MNVTLRAPEKTDFSVLAALRNDAAVQRQLMIEPRKYSGAAELRKAMPKFSIVHQYKPD